MNRPKEMGLRWNEFSIAVLFLCITIATTGVPVMLGGAMMLSGKWSGKGVFNMEQFDPDPFMEEIGKWGLPWNEAFGSKLV